jgi:hypothetical protein
MAFVASDPEVNVSGFYNISDDPGLPFPDDQLINAGPETNVTILESSVYNANGPNTLSYDLSFLAPGFIDQLAGCNNYAAVCVISEVAAPRPTFYDCDCYNRTGNGAIFSTNGGITDCQQLASAQATARAIGPILFEGGNSSFVPGTLAVPSGPFSVQVITGQEADAGGFCDCQNEGAALDIPGFDCANGALVDNFAVLEESDFCFEQGFGENFLNGFNAFFIPFVPDEFAGQFNVLPGNEGNAGADVVMINFADQYLPNYSPTAAFVNARPIIYDADEIPASCGDIDVCFARLGIDADIIISDDFTPASPSPSPTATPTIGPITPTPTIGPTNNPRGSSSCAIAGNPIQLGTAMANVLIPLIPLAFAFGVRAVRRRKK